MDDFFRTIFPSKFAYKNCLLNWTPRIPRPLPLDLLWPPEDVEIFWGKKPKDLGTFSQGTTPRIPGNICFFGEGNPWFVTCDAITPIGEKRTTPELDYWLDIAPARHTVIFLCWRQLYVSYEHNPGQNSWLSIRDEYRIIFYFKKTRIFVPGHFSESSHSPNQVFPWNAQQFSCFCCLFFRLKNMSWPNGWLTDMKGERWTKRSQASKQASMEIPPSKHSNL